jgi:hypothetical protein
LERFCSTQGETKGIKDFINVLMLYREHKAGEVEAAAELAVEHHVSSSEGVRHLLVHTGAVAITAAPLIAWSSLSPPDVSVYGQLGGVQ